MKSQLLTTIAAVLLVGCAVNFFTIHNRPATHQLHFAADRGNIEAAKQAIANGAAGEHAGCTPPQKKQGSSDIFVGGVEEEI
jgi:predicted outer membrane protein